MRALGFDAKKPEVLKIIKDSGSERGLLSQEEFTRTMTEYIRDRDPLEEIRRAFQLFDDDNTGKISLKNLKRVAKELGEVLEEEELLAMIEVWELGDVTYRRSLIWIWTGRSTRRSLLVL
jgi:centrin-3